MKRIILLLFFSFMALQCSALNPREVFDAGKRAFELGNWREAEQFFSRFLKTWPENPLVNDADYFLNLSAIRLNPDQTEDKLKKIASLSEKIKLFKAKLPETADLSEMQADVDFLKMETGTASPTKINFLQLSPETLLHFFDRGWLPPEGKDPISLLSWLQNWSKSRDFSNFSNLRSKIALLSSKALFMIFISPLANDSLEEKLKKLDFWPIQKAIRDNLKIAYDLGDLEVKRNTALLGVSFEYLKNERKGSKFQFWQNYLYERGLSSQDAWCPISLKK
ncbi:MAG: hypothetical protein HQM08_10635 [Candidatus Riflebacteria bacterium]|nr:hypothetical protein [Candidatus Riflebacteria bacterium]